MQNKIIKEMAIIVNSFNYLTCGEGFMDILGKAAKNRCNYIEQDEKLRFIRFLKKKYSYNQELDYSRLEYSAEFERV